MKQVNNVCPFCGQIISYRSFKDQDVRWSDTHAVHGMKRQYFHYSCYMRTMKEHWEAQFKWEGGDPECQNEK